MEKRIQGKLSRIDIQKRIISSLSKKNYPKPQTKEKKEKEVEKIESLLFRKPNSNSKKFRTIRRDPKDLNMLDKVNFIINKRRPIYLGFGGMGDFMLTLAAYENRKIESNIIFYANNNSINFIRDMSKAFETKISLFPNIYGSQLAKDVFKLLKISGLLQISGHLPDKEDLCYTDWQKNTSKYKEQIINKTDWLTKFGINKDLPKENLVGITPSGSWKSNSVKRFLTREEFTQVYMKVLENNKIPIIFSSELDFNYYCVENKSLTTGYYLTKDTMHNFDKLSKNFIDCRFFLSAINNCEKMISMDTWIKTYTCLIEKPTIVIANRDANGNDKKYGEWGTDFIFLNTDFWPTLKVVGYKDFISENFIL